MRNSLWWTIGGVVALAMGVWVLVNPVAGSVAATIVAGWGFILVGFLELVAVFSARGGWNKALLALIGVISVYLGITVLGNPIEGLLALTLAVGLLFVSGAILRLLFAVQLKRTAAFWPLILTSVASLLLGFMTLADFPQSARSILGILLGVQLLFEGAALLTMAGAARRAERGVTDPA